MISYAQRLEDVLLARVLNDVAEGFYVDVGANDPEYHSVTKHFYDSGWSGINIEPSLYWHEKLLQERPRDINVNVAIARSSGTLNFHEIEGTGLSTFSEEYAKRGEARGYKRRSYEVATQTLNAILDMYLPNREFHFLKVDVEGFETDVLSGIDLAKYRPWVILVEAVEPSTGLPTHDSWEPLLLDADYRFALFDGLNRWYLATEFPELWPRLSCPADDYQRANLAWARAQLENRLGLAEERILELERRIAERSDDS